MDSTRRVSSNEMLPEVSRTNSRRHVPDGSACFPGRRALQEVTASSERSGPCSERFEDQEPNPEVSWVHEAAVHQPRHNQAL